MNTVHRAVLGVAATVAIAVGIVAPATAYASPGSAHTTTPSTPSVADQDAAADSVMGSSMTKAAALSAAAAVSAPAGVPGFDVSTFQGRTPAFGTAYANGARFVFVKATDGTPGTAASGNPTGSVADHRVQQTSDAKSAGLLVGNYHYSRPFYSSGPTQASFFLANAPAWQNDGKSLPPVLDMEVTTNPTKEGGTRCWGLSQADMVSWIQGYVATIVAAEGVQPLIYTNQDFWNTCTGNSTAFPHDRLFVAYYPTTTTNTPVAPTGLGPWAFWQWSQTESPFPGDQDVFNGTLAQLQALTARNGSAVGRLAGADAYATAASIAGSAFTPAVSIPTGDATTPGSIPLAYVATRANYPDALSGAAAAGFQDAPVLLTDPGTLPAPTIAELAQLNPKRIVVLGGPNAVSDSVLGQLRSPATGTAPTSVTRIAGTDRFDTSALASAAFPVGGTVYLATGTNFPDALAGAAVAAGAAADSAGGAQAGAMLLVRPDVVPDQVVTALQRLEPTRVVVLGGTTAVNDSVVAQVRTILGADERIDRWFGADRFETSAVIAQQAFGTSTVPAAFLATGVTFPDALAGAPVAGHFGGPVLLVRNDVVPDPVRAELGALRPAGTVVLGGPIAIDGSVEAGLG
ncbi:cell wall-binding repeat-containing protein [Curtobacterium sp. RRHDQ10]|uniref:cell wall-binding repeat-containing protein n=1 Tax=Curtobacterium phyllosphaerae TaxID=3413379 RepID=UPI003BF2E175